MEKNSTQQKNKIFELRSVMRGGPESAEVKMWTATRKGCCFMCYP